MDHIEIYYIKTCTFFMSFEDTLGIPFWKSNDAQRVTDVGVFIETHMVNVPWRLAQLENMQRAMWAAPRSVITERKLEKYETKKRF